MALKKCQRCGEELSTGAYIAVNSIVHGGSLPICRHCLAKQIDKAYSEGNGWNVVDKICQWADVPFVPEHWEEMYEGHGRDAIGVYISTFRGKPYDTLDWKQYNDVYLQIQEENRVLDALPEVREGLRRRLRQKWGQQYDDESLEYLENLHQGLLSSQNIVGALNEDQALKLCKISLIIEEKMRSGMEFDKDLKAYDQLSKLANLTSKVVKDANEFNSIGEVCAFLEKKGFKVKYYDGAVRDEADFTAKDIKYWLQSLYVNETGIAEEIEQRIENLKVTAQMTGGQFNEKEFRDYLSDGLTKIEDEDFKLDLE